MVKKELLFLSVLLSLLTLSIKSQEIHFNKEVFCSKQNEHGCQSWETNLKTFMKQKRILYQNLPPQTQLKAQFYHVQLKDLKIGDRIYGYDNENKQMVLTEVIAWAERDEENEGEYVEIDVDGASYVLSQNSVIHARLQEQIQWIELKSINGEDIALKTFEISRKAQKLKIKGRFAPITNIGNFFILPASSQATETTKKETQMLLLNCFPKQDSTLTFPISDIFHFLFKLIYILPSNPQPQSYLSPLIQLFTLFSNFQQQSFLKETVVPQSLMRHMRQNERFLVTTNSQERRTKRNAVSRIIEGLLTYLNPAVL